MNEKIKDGILEDLTKLLIKQDMEDKKRGKDTYVKKTRIYRDLIKWFRECDIWNNY